jgi:EAL and modified HD-GYP domain-containing signal transduction protein
MASSPVSGGRTASSSVHVGRQPIHDAQGHLHGYELLFRDTATATSADADGDGATTATILAAFSEFGSENLLGGRTGYINVTRAFLVGELPLPFAPENAVLEVLETVRVDAPVVAGAGRLAAEGYRLALDDFTWSPDSVPLLRFADLVKIDVLAMPWEEVLTTVERCRPYGVRFLAEKVEDEPTLRRCLDEGFELFQGYHLGRPETLTAETLTPVYALTLDLLGRLGDPSATAGDVEDVVRSDPALSYRLLRIANSAASGVRQQVSSVRDALVLVGVAKLRAWLVLLSLGTEGSGDDIAGALTRARTCEQVARSAGTARPDVAFTVGLLHGVAEALRLPPATMLERMPSLSPDLADALGGAPGPLRQVLDAVLAYERADLTALERAPVPLSVMAEAYLSALAWTTETSRAASS